MDSPFLKKWQELATVPEQPWFALKVYSVLRYPVKNPFEAMCEYNEDRDIRTQTMVLMTRLTLR